MVANEKEFQRALVLPEKQVQLQSSPALKDIPSQSSDGNPEMDVWPAKTVRDDLKHRFNTLQVGAPQMIQRGPEA